MKLFGIPVNQSAFIRSVPPLSDRLQSHCDNNSDAAEIQILRIIRVRHRILKVNQESQALIEALSAIANLTTYTLLRRDTTHYNHPVDRG
jgi:hypothetical protein